MSEPTSSSAPNLSLQIPNKASHAPPQEPDFHPINMPATPAPTRPNFLSTSSPSSSPLKNSLSFKNKGLGSDVESGGEANTVSSGPSFEPPREDKSSVSRSFSFIFSPRIKRTFSFPVAPSAQSGGRDGTEGGASGPLDSNVKGAVISRSLSVPANEDQRLKRVDSVFRVIPSTADSFASEAGNNEAGGEGMPEEEAVCRICFIELCEGGQTLRLECSCRGELAVAHQDCAVKWFSMKGSKTCDVCNQQVQNLPVTLIRIPSPVTQVTGSHQEFGGYSSLSDVPMLTVVTMFAYFCFLEELLSGKMRTSAISVAFPFCCLLGLLSSTISCTVVKRRFIWIYAVTQFAFVVLFAHIFYSVVGIQAVPAILLATLAGFGVAVTGSSVVELFRWRRRRQLRRIAQAGIQQSEAPESPNSSGVSAAGEPVASV